MTKKEFQTKLEELYKKYVEAIKVDLETIPVEKMMDPRGFRNYDVFSYCKIGEQIDKFVKEHSDIKPDYSFWTGSRLQKRCSELNRKVMDKIDTYHISLIQEPRPEDKIRIDDEFDVNGDIIITDPCYIRKYIEPEHSRNTIYGDWSCSIWQCKKDKDPKPHSKPFGKFCADSGMVCVTNIKNCSQRKEIEDWVKEHNWCATIINNFKGKVKYIVKTCYYPYSKQWSCDDSLRIRGEGTKDGKEFCFTTLQTGF